MAALSPEGGLGLLCSSVESTVPHVLPNFRDLLT